MPPKAKFTKEQIIDASLHIIRTSGPSAVTARAVGIALDSSPKVIFSCFSSMEELMHETIVTAYTHYESYLKEDMSQTKYPPYKASGMAYIRFATEEKELFKLLFMRDHSQESPDISLPEEILRLLMENNGLTYEAAHRFHFEMWLYVHGIATMIVTNFLSFSTEEISEMLSDVYQSLIDRFSKEKV